MINTELLLGLPIPIELREGTYNKSKFKGLYLNKYKLKDFLTKEIGYETYMSWCNAITLKPKDIADTLWVDYKTYYKEVDEWGFTFTQCFDFQNSKVRDDSLILEGLKFMFGYEFSPSIIFEEKEPEKALFFNIFDKDKSWLAKIDKENFERIRAVIREVNHIQPSELSKWNYVNSKHEKKHLEYYYDERNFSKTKYELSLKTIFLFLENETQNKVEDLLNKSLYYIYNLYNMKVATLRALALNIGIYGGNIKIDSQVKDGLLFGVLPNNEVETNVATGNDVANVKVEMK